MQINMKNEGEKTILFTEELDQNIVIENNTITYIEKFFKQLIIHKEINSIEKIEFTQKAAAYVDSLDDEVKSLFTDLLVIVNDVSSSEND